MAFRQDIVQERGKLIKATLGSKLGKNISDRILMPILDRLENDYEAVLSEAANWARDEIVKYLTSNEPSGRTYKIVHYEPGVGSKTLRSYTASAEGEPPSHKNTGTLAKSISYEVDSDGSFKVGLLIGYNDPPVGTELKSSGFLGQWGKILQTPGMMTQTSVGKYGRALEGGFINKEGVYVERPWFEKTMDEIRDELRQRIRKGMSESIRKATRKISVRKAIIFKVYYK